MIFKIKTYHDYENTPVETYINTKNILSIEKYVQDSFDQFVGLRINGIEFPIYSFHVIEDRYVSYRTSLDGVPHRIIKNEDEYEKEKLKAKKYLDKFYNEIVKIMKKEN